MLDDKAWLRVPVHPRAVGWGRGLGFVQARQVLLGEGISLITWLSALMHRHVETGKDRPQTVDTSTPLYKYHVIP